MFRLMGCVAVLVVLNQGEVVAASEQINITVSGKACVYFAGQTASSLAGASDIFYGDHLVPATLPPFLDVSEFATLSVTASGTWGHGSSSHQISGPDGRGTYEATRSAYNYFGVSRISNAPLNKLLGVFTTDEGPVQGSPPPRLDAVLDDMTLPDLNQAFSIGGNLSNINVPSGATILHLGHNDAYDWANNIGSVAVTIEATPIPEPSTLILLATGAFGLLLHGWRRRK